MMKMFQLYPRMPGPAGAAIQHLFASAFAAVVFPDPAMADTGIDVRHAEQDAAIFLPRLQLAIVAAPVGEVSYSMQRSQLASYLEIDLLTIDLSREAGRVEVALDYGSPVNRGREAAPHSVLWLSNAGVFLMPMDQSGATPAIQLTADGFRSCPLPYASEAEFVDGMEAASFAAERARAAQRVADLTADVKVSIR